MTFVIVKGGGTGRLGFTGIVLEAFTFLERFGFVPVVRESTLVRFESQSVFVNVYHGRSSYHVGLELGRRDRDELFSAYELLTAVAPDALDRSRCQAVDKEVLERCVRALSEVVEERCAGLLNGDEGEFKSLLFRVGQMREAETLQAQFGATLDRADLAWEEKRLDEAAGLYEKAVRVLDITRRRRLDYLHRRGKGT